jgi:elongation factor 2 kinase
LTFFQLPRLGLAITFFSRLLNRCGVERFIDGPYRKHNNNFGFVSEEERNTPQAFSHFTYEISNHKLLVCDIQGVGDMYTVRLYFLQLPSCFLPHFFIFFQDPQIHSIEDPDAWGKGNLGQKGIDKFLQTHRCNAICSSFFFCAYDVSPPLHS